MTDSDTNWLTLSQAAARSGCSIKTLYRHMNRGRLPFRKAGDNRRYVNERDVLALFPLQNPLPKSESAPHLADLERAMRAVTETLSEQTRLLERMIALYQPKTLEQLIAKRWAPDDASR